MWVNHFLILELLLGGVKRYENKAQAGSKKSGTKLTQQYGKEL